MAHYWNNNSLYNNGTTSTPVNSRNQHPYYVRGSDLGNDGTVIRRRYYSTDGSSGETCGCTLPFIHSVLFIFNFILFASGGIILAVSFLYGTDHITGRYSNIPYHLDLIRGLLPLDNLLNLVHFSMVSCGLAACLIAFVHFWCNCLQTIGTKKQSDRDSSYSSASQYSHPQVPRFSRSSVIMGDFRCDEEHLSLTDLKLSGHEAPDIYGPCHGHCQDFGEIQRLRLYRKKRHTSISHTACSLGTFIFFLVLLLAFQLMVGLLAFMSVLPYSQGAHSQVSLSQENNATLHSNTERSENFMNSTHKFFNESLPHLIANEETRDIFGRIEQRYGCCGVNSFEDYANSSRVPDSCCKSISAGCGYRKHPSNIYYDGCWDKMSLSIRHYLTLLGSLAIGLSFVPLFGLLFACCLFIRAT